MTTTKPKKLTLDRVNFRLTPDDSNKLKELAALSGKGYSDIFRDLLHGRRLNSIQDKQVLVELKRIGNNLNQAVKTLHILAEKNPTGDTKTNIETLQKYIESLQDCIAPVAAVLTEPRI